MTEIETIKQLLSRHKQEYKDMSAVMDNTALEAGAALRELLVPILHRWGIGMERGGDFVYPEPNIQKMVDGEWEWEVIMDGDTCDHLLAKLHEELWYAMYTKVSSHHKPEFTLLDYMENIPLPEGLRYIWIAEDESGLLSTVSFGDTSDNTIRQDLIPDTIYYGPVTEAYLTDILTIPRVVHYLNDIPAYTLDDEGRWKRYYRDY